MSVYNLDDKKFIWEFSGGRNVSKLLKAGEPVLLKHYSFPVYRECKVVSVEGGSIKISLQDLDCGPGIKVHDPVVLNISSKKRVFIAGGAVSTVELLQGLVVTLKINKIVKRDNLRKYERYCVSLEASVKRTKHPEEEVPAAVRDISLGGVKINSAKEMSIGEAIYASVSLDKDYKVGFRGKIVRKSCGEGGYEYGVEIFEITENNLLILRNFINGLKYEV